MCGYCTGEIERVQRWRDTAAVTTAKMMTLMMMTMTQVSVPLASAADTQYNGMF